VVERGGRLRQRMRERTEAEDAADDAQRAAEGTGQESDRSDS
jgi:hypothetical protein